MAWRISKQFDFCYGHRVHCQTLDPGLSLNRLPKCRYEHGHQAEIHTHLESDGLNEQGMVVDFCNLAWYKKFLDDYIDHKFIIDINDPLYRRILGISKESESSYQFNSVRVPGTTHVAGYVFNEEYLDLAKEPSEMQEYYRGFFVVTFIPTSENLSKWVYECVQARMSEVGVTVSRVDWWETPKSCATYTP